MTHIDVIFIIYTNKLFSIKPVGQTEIETLHLSVTNNFPSTLVHLLFATKSITHFITRKRRHISSQSTYNHKCVLSVAWSVSSCDCAWEAAGIRFDSDEICTRRRGGRELLEWFVDFLLISWQPLGFKSAIPLFNEQYSLTIAGGQFHTSLH